VLKGAAVFRNRSHENLLQIFWTLWQGKIFTRSSAVAVIADRIAQTIKPVSVTSLRTAGTHDPIQRVEFMNAPKLYLLKRDH